MFDWTCGASLSVVLPAKTQLLTSLTASQSEREMSPPPLTYSQETIHTDSSSFSSVSQSPTDKYIPSFPNIHKRGLKTLSKKEKGEEKKKKKQGREALIVHAEW